MEAVMKRRAILPCPGCGLEMPETHLTYEGYYHASPECWSVYTEVLAAEYEDAPLFGLVHQLTVDSYAVQHAGGSHPDKSVSVHLVGLYLVLERGLPPTSVPAYFQRLVASGVTWPRLVPPESKGAITVFDIAMAQSPQQHAAGVREWAEQIWKSWSRHHATVATLAKSCFANEPAAEATV